MLCWSSINRYHFRISNWEGCLMLENFRRFQKICMWTAAGGGLFWTLVLRAPDKAIRSFKMMQVSSLELNLHYTHCMCQWGPHLRQEASLYSEARVALGLSRWQVCPAAQANCARVLLGRLRRCRIMQKAHCHKQQGAPAQGRTCSHSDAPQF